MNNEKTQKVGGVFLDATPTVQEKYNSLLPEYQRLISKYKNCVEKSRQCNCEEVFDNIYAVTFTIANYSRTASGQRYIKMQTPYIKLHLRKNIETYETKYNVKGLYFFELSKKFRPHIHGVVEGTPEGVFNFNNAISQIFGDQFVVKPPFYSKSSDWISYMMKDGVPLNKHYLRDSGESFGQRPKA